MNNRRIVRAPRGAQLNAKSWQTEGAAADADEQPRSGGGGAARRTSSSMAARAERRATGIAFDRIVAALKALGGRRDAARPVRQAGRRLPDPRRRAARADRQLQSGRRAGRPGTFQRARAQGPDDVRPDDRGLVDLYRLAGHHRGTFETFSKPARQHYGGDLRGRWILTAGLGGMGGAQPLAGVMAGCSVLVVECRSERVERRITSGYLDRAAANLDEALAIDRAILPREARLRRAAWQRGGSLRGDPAPRHPARHRDRPDRRARPDQRFPPGRMDARRMDAPHRAEPDAVKTAAKASMARHVRSMLAFRAKGIPVFDYGNNIRQMAKDAASKTHSRIPDLSRIHTAAILPRAWRSSAGSPCPAIRRT